MERRTALKGGAYLALAAVLPLKLARTAGAQSVDFVDAVDEMRGFLIDHFGGLTYRPVDPHPVVTGHPQLNGGLRGWAWEALEQPGDLVVQICAKHDDIHDRHRADVLPTYHVLQCYRKTGDTPADAFAELLDFMLAAARLDPQRLAFVSTSVFEPLRPIVEEFGLDWDRQVWLRDEAEARQAGDGSGYIRIQTPDGPAEAATVGLYYWLDENTAPRPITNPPGPGWTEVGETVLDEAFQVAFVIGVERLILAMTGAYPTWDEQVEFLVAHVENSGDQAVLETVRGYPTR